MVESKCGIHPNTYDGPVNNWNTGLRQIENPKLIMRQFEKPKMIMRQFDKDARMINFGMISRQIDNCDHMVRTK